MMDYPITIQKLNYKKLVIYTDDFSESNYIGRFQFGKLYRGLIPNPRRKRYVMVKIWEVPEIYNYKPGDNKIRLMVCCMSIYFKYLSIFVSRTFDTHDIYALVQEETILLRHEMLISHPGMLKLYGYCCEGEHLGVVYEIRPFDSLFNLIPKDGFTWLQRIKAALGLASILKFLHAGNSSFYVPFIVQNLDAAHVVLDEEYNPKLCDFGLISGGIFPYRKTYSGHHVIGCYGYTDIAASSRGDCSNKQDVFAFGVILVSLISKRVYTEEDRQAGTPFVYEWAIRESEAYEKSEGDMKNTNFSLVHKSLAAECDLLCPADAHKITMLALECVNKAEHERPTMKQVFRSLRKLEVVKQHADYLKANTELCPWEIDI
ncbi:hypothetical protein DH2020_028348 [Rehmannia glutinosa]|uniref:Protein kinase domain-containing protein n=1 Tax=Rehmannia glutinosa TaxID=99300 RepID=A0ABR0VV76_REHGL